MREFSASLLAISFFICFLCGCEKAEEPFVPNIGAVSKATIVTEHITMDVEVTAYSGDDVSITLLTPESLKGLNYHKVNSTLYIEYNGLKCTTAQDYLTPFNPFEVIFDVFSSLSKTPLKSTGKEGELCVYSGTASSGTYTLYADKKSGKILKIVPSFAECEITFSYE